jgi:hypothetical protein
MSQKSGDKEMADATAGAEQDGSVVEDFGGEKQRLKLVLTPMNERECISDSIDFTATTLYRHCSLICIRERRSHPWKRAPIHDHEEVRFTAERRTSCKRVLT